MHLIARDITKSFNARRVVGPLSLDIRAGEALCLFGPSGAGKTTVLRMLAGLETPTAGQVTLGGESLPSHTTLKPGVVGMVFQEPALWPHMTVQQHLHFVLKPLKLGRGILITVAAVGWSLAVYDAVAGAMGRRREWADATGPDTI